MYFGTLFCVPSPESQTLVYCQLHMLYRLWLPAYCFFLSGARRAGTLLEYYFYGLIQYYYVKK